MKLLDILQLFRTACYRLQTKFRTRQCFQKHLSVHWDLCVMPLPVQEGLCPGDVSVSGVSDQGDPPTETLPGTVKSGRYASYWNAFLSKIF